MALDYFNVCVIVIEASNLPYRNITTQACVQVGTKSNYTTIVKNTDRPYYNEYFVFDLFTNLTELMNTVITISIVSMKRRYMPRTLVGSISMDLATLWARPGRRLAQWLPVTHPNDPIAQEKGLVNCEINIEASEKFLNLPQLSSPEALQILGRKRVRYMVQLYRCVGLTPVSFQNKYKKVEADVFIRVYYAGNTGSTTKRQRRDTIDWNEQVSFIELFPPLFQRITIKLFIKNKLISTKHLLMTDISNLSVDSSLPTFGPSYVHLYSNEFLYRASILIAIDAEYVASYKHLEKLHGVTTQPIPPAMLFVPVESFLCYGVLFDAVLTNKKYDRSKIHLSMSIGSEGLSSTKDEWNNSITDKYNALLNRSQLVCMALHEQKPCVFLRSDWVDSHSRLYNSNMIIKITDDMKEKLNYVHDLISRGATSEAGEMLRKSIQMLKKECLEISTKLSKGITALDAERENFIVKQLTYIASVMIGTRQLDILLEHANQYLSILESISEEIQESLPYIVLALKWGRITIGRCRIHPREIIFSTVDKKSGKRSGRITSLSLKAKDENNVGRLDMWLWLGFWDQVSNCLQQLPPGHQSITESVALPLFLTYTTAYSYTVVCHIFGGHIISVTDICDSSVKILISKQCRQTHISKKSLSPVWKETLIFDDLQLYPTSSYISVNPPSLTVELWNHSTHPITLIGSSSIIPNTRLQPVSGTIEYNLQWITVGLHAQILAAFEIIHMTGEMGSSDTTNKGRLSKVIHNFLEPTTVPYRLEVVFWGIRALDARGLKGLTHPQVIIQCGNTEIMSEVMTRTNFGQNFKRNLHIVGIELPETKVYCPPLIVRLKTSSGYIGCDIDKNIHRYVCSLPTEKEWEDLITDRKSIVDRAQKRVSSVRVTMPDLIPLLEIKSDRRSSVLLDTQRGIKMQLISVFNSLKTQYLRLRSFRKDVIADLLDEDEDEEYDWWYKYFSGEIQVYKNSLEENNGFNAFNDVLKYFLIKQQKEGDLKDIAKVKIMICLYQWPPEISVVNTQGQDVEGGFLHQDELSDCAKLLVRVYCVKAYNLHPSDLNGSADPYIEIATPSKCVSDKSNYIPKELNPVFGKCYEIMANFPVDSMLAVRVMDYDRFTLNDLIGETVIDLENRYYSKHRATCGLPSTYSTSGYNIWRDVENPTDILERLCNTYNIPLPQYFGKSILVGSKEFFAQKNKYNQKNKYKDIGEKHEILALAALHQWENVPVVGCPLVPEHVETRPLFHKGKPGIEQGKLEMWVDLFDLSLGTPPPPLDISSRQPQPYELRVIIWNTAKVPLVDDTYFVGKKHTDIFVKGWLWDATKSQSTDVHYTSLNGDGNFNWRFIFPFLYLKQEKKMVIYKKEVFSMKTIEQKVPALLHLQVWDKDRISANDFIGSMAMELCAMPRGQLSKRACKVKKESTPSNTLNLFRIKHTRGWWPFLPAKNLGKELTGGLLEAEFHLLTEEEAASSPAGMGRSEPSALPPPERPELKFRFWMAPFRVMTHLMFNVHKGKLALCVAISAVVLFILVGIYSIPMFLIKKIMEA